MWKVRGRKVIFAFVLLPQTLNSGFFNPVKGVIRGQICKPETLDLWTLAPHHKSTQAELILLQTALNPPSACLALPYAGPGSHHLSDDHCSLQHLSPPEACSPQGSPRSLSRTHLWFPPMALSMKKRELTRAWTPAWAPRTPATFQLRVSPVPGPFPCPSFH